jgi:multidrug efflux pump
MSHPAHLFKWRSQHIDDSPRDDHGGATILALFPLAIEGGPLWRPLCYAQIGGLAVATFITLLLVPVFYSIFVLDLKWIKWDVTAKER